MHVEGQGPDPIPENNRARVLVGVSGSRPVLCVSPGAATGLPAILAKGGLQVKSLPASQCNWTLEELAGCSAVVLENTPASLLGHVGLENLAAWVSQSGGGLMITGGKDSYGPGGYYKSSLEPIMPVSMELRREHRKLSLAIVVALDRSGSMAMTVPDGRMKIDLANLATAEVVEMLGPMDQFGCLAVDSAVHEIVPLSDVVDKRPMQNKIRRIDSAGGGIFIYEALKAAVRMVASAQAGTKHIILFADAADSEEPGDYKTLVDKCARAGITVSVAGLGTEKDCDAGLLKDIARRGRGQIMFTNVAQELPRLFAQDTFLVARSAFLEDSVPVRATGGLLSITRQSLGELPNLGGYNLCYLRPGANLAMVSVDEYKAPVLASWQAGMGRVLCYTGEADGQYTGPIAGWKNTGEFFTSLARWTAGKSQGLGPGVLPTQELRNGVCRVELQPRSRTQLHPLQSFAGVDRAFGPAGRNGRRTKSDDELVVGRHVVGRDSAGRRRDDPDDGIGCGRGADHVGTHVFALLARIPAAQGRGRSGGVGALGPYDWRLRAVEPGRHLERHPPHAANAVAGALSPPGRRRNLSAGSAPASHGVIVPQSGSVGNIGAKGGGEGCRMARSSAQSPNPKAGRTRGGRTRRYADSCQAFRRAPGPRRRDARSPGPCPATCPQTHRTRLKGEPGANRGRAW